MRAAECSSSRGSRVTIRSVALVLVSALAMSCTVRTPTTASPSASPSPEATSTPSPSATASSTASPTPVPSAARPGIVVTAAGAIPADSAYVLVQNTGAERVLLIDLAAKKSREVVRFDRPQVSRRSVVLSASADGQTLAILERSDATLLLHVVRPATGEIGRASCRERV